MLLSLHKDQLTKHTSYTRLQKKVSTLTNQKWAYSSSCCTVKCFLCSDTHFIWDCEFLLDIKQDTQRKASRSTAVKLHRLTAVKLHQKLIYKDKEKRHRVFDAEVSDDDDDDFFS